MSAAALLKASPKPADAEIDAAMNGTLRHRGTNPRICAASHRAAVLLAGGG